MGSGSLKCDLLPHTGLGWYTPPPATLDPTPAAAPWGEECGGMVVANKGSEPGGGLLDQMFLL